MDLKISDMKVGAQLRFGKYGVKNDCPLPIIWLKCTSNSDFITQSVVDFLCWDAYELDGLGREVVCNPDYASSNILNFINSVDGAWFHETHRTDAPPASYVTHYGFLYHFEEYEVESLVKKSIEVDGKKVATAMRLPSSGEVSKEGSFELFHRKGIRARGTDDMILHRGHSFDRYSFIPYWVRDKAANDNMSHCAMYLSVSCDLRYAHPPADVGLRPVCSINPDTPIVLGEDGVYYLKPHSVRQDVYTNKELFDFLGLTQP